MVYAGYMHQFVMLTYHHALFIAKLKAFPLLIFLFVRERVRKLLFCNRKPSFLL